MKWVVALAIHAPAHKKSPALISAGLGLPKKAIE